MDFNLQQEWGNVSGAPLLFLGSLLLAGGAVWLFFHFIYKAKIERLEQDVKSEQAEAARLRGRIVEYEQKAGRTPDEAHERIARLEQKVAALTPKQRNLTEEQRRAIIDTIQGTPDYPGSKIAIGYSHVSEESARYAHQFQAAFLEGGWEVECYMVMVARLHERGLNLATHKLKGGSAMTHKLAEALTNAGLEFDWVEIPGLQTSGTLFVDMAE